MSKKNNLNNKFFLDYFLSLLQKHFIFFLLPLLFAFVLALSESLLPYFLKLIVDELTKTSDLELNLKEHQYIIGLNALFYILLTALVNLMFRFRDYFKWKMLPLFKEVIILRSFQHLSLKPYHFFLKFSSGDLVNRIFQITRSLEVLLSMTVDIFMWRVLSLLIASFYLSKVSSTLTFLLLLWGTFFVSLSCYLSIQTKVSVHDFSQARHLLVAQLNDTLSGVANIFHFFKWKEEESKIQSKVCYFQEKERQMLWRILTTGFLQGLMATALTTLTLYQLLKLIYLQVISSGDFLFVMFVSNTMVRNVYSISFDLVQLYKEVHLIIKNIELLEQDILIQVREKKLIPQKGSLVFKNMYFKYEGQNFLFKKINLTLKGGQKVGIIGRSGAGKSTLISLLMRLYHPNSGEIFIDNQPIKTLSEKSLREEICLVPQDPILFHRSILENILIANSKATLEQVFQACQKVDFHDFVLGLPEGYHTLVGERGTFLSGGQKQKLALARALLRKASIIILDEPTSALDSLSESIVQKALKQLFVGKTVLVVAHKLKTVKNLDKLIIFEEGKIVDEGTHEQLLKKSFLYQQLLDLS